MQRRAATSLKLPRELKTRIAAAADAAGKTPHAFMIEALERETARAEQYDAFIEDAVEAEREHERSGTHYAADDVFAYMSARAAGKRPRRPRPKTWRK
jgi:predicted transcriptional regulator